MASPVLGEVQIDPVVCEAMSLKFGMAAGKGSVGGKSKAGTTEDRAAR